MTDDETDEYVSKRLGVPALHTRVAEIEERLADRTKIHRLTKQRLDALYERIDILEGRHARLTKTGSKQGARIGSLEERQIIMAEQRHLVAKRIKQRLDVLRCWVLTLAASTASLGMWQAAEALGWL